MAQRNALKVLNSTFRHFIQERQLAYKFEHPQKDLWKNKNSFPTLSNSSNPYHFLLSLSTKRRLDEHYFELLANTPTPNPPSQLILVLAPNLEFKDTQSPAIGDAEYQSPGVFMPYYVEPLAPYSSNIWQLELLYDFWSNYPDVTSLSNKEVQAYLSANSKDTKDICYQTLHFHVDLRILKSSGCPESQGMPPGTVIQMTDFLAQTGRLRSLHLVGSHLYPEMARQISTRVIRIIKNRLQDGKN
jgi:hypothetical protein